MNGSRLTDTRVSGAHTDVAAELHDPALIRLRHAEVDALRDAHEALTARGWDEHDILVHAPAPGTPPASTAPLRPVADFDPDARTTEYVYIRLANHVAALIDAGELRSRSRLPGEREMALQYGVSVGTVRRVRMELERRGLVVTLPAKGTYVL